MNNRRGVTLLDTMAAIVAVATLVSISVQIAANASHQRRELQRRTLAEIEGANALERVAALKWADISSDAKLPIELSETARESLPQGTLKIEVQAIEAAGDSPAARRARVEIGWQDRAGHAVKPVRLTKWLYPPRAEEAP